MFYIICYLFILYNLCFCSNPQQTQSPRAVPPNTTNIPATNTNTNANTNNNVATIPPVIQQNIVINNNIEWDKAVLLGNLPSVKDFQLRFLLEQKVEAPVVQLAFFKVYI